MPNLISIKEAAQQLHISASFLYQLTARGRIACYRIGTRILFSPDQLQAFLAAQLIPAAAAPAGGTP